MRFLFNRFFVIACLCALFSYQPIGSAIERGPHALIPCTVLFMERSSHETRSGEFRYHLNGFNQGILDHLEMLDSKDLTFFERLRRQIYYLNPTRLVESFGKKLFGERDLKVAHDGVTRAIFSRTLGLAWNPQNQESIAGVIGRMAQIEEDLADPDVISIAFQIRGKQPISDYLSFIKNSINEMDQEISAQTDKEFSFFTPFRAIAAAGQAYVAYLNFKTIAILANTQPPAPHNVASLLLILPTTYAFVYPQVKSAALFAGALISKSAQFRYERMFTQRRYEYFEYLNKMRDLNENPSSPDDFAYNTADVGVPESFVRELNEAFDQKRKPNPEVLLANARREHFHMGQKIADDQERKLANDQDRFFLTDQMYFRDEHTQEPVLLTILRIKKQYKLPSPRKKNSKTVEKRELDFVPGMQPAPASNK